MAGRTLAIPFLAQGLLPTLPLLSAAFPFRVGRANEVGLIIMSETPMETFEQAEHAEHASHSGNRFVATVAVSIAVLAALAAASGSLEAFETAVAASAKADAVLLQNKATDNWNFFQAKSLKKNMYDIAAAQGGPKVSDFQAQSLRYGTESADIQKTATDLEAQSNAALANGERHESRAHRLTIASTFLHIAIAIATISIITTGRRWPWYTSLALGVVGIVLTGSAYLG
jgi:hypothetical protein